MFLAVLQSGWNIFTSNIGLPSPLQYFEIMDNLKAYFIGIIHFLEKRGPLSIKAKNAHNSLFYRCFTSVLRMIYKSVLPLNRLTHTL
jgi:hypothetical protein